MKQNKTQQNTYKFSTAKVFQQALYIQDSKLCFINQAFSKKILINANDRIIEKHK